MNNVLSREQFFAFVSKFRTRAQSKELEPIDMMFYSITRGLPANRGFTPITNTRKLNAGQDPDYSYKTSKQHLKYLLTHKHAWIQGRYGVDFTPEIQGQLLEVLK